MQDYSGLASWMTVVILAFVFVRSAWLDRAETKAKDQAALEKKWKP